MGTPVSAHFMLSEFDSHDGIPYPQEWIAERLSKLVGVLERVRTELGAPCTILSGFRSEAHNEELRKQSEQENGTSGVAKNSQHVQGRAADIVFKGWRPVDVHTTILHLYNTGELPDLGGLGVYPGWVHVDVRSRPDDNHLAQWTGAGFGSEPVA
jgi:uncharacterized protein YcbK (DUF882 family)